MINVEDFYPVNQVEVLAAAAAKQSLDDAGGSAACPPSCNTGGISESLTLQVGYGSQKKKQLFKRAIDGGAFIDTITFTISESVFIPENSNADIESIAAQISEQLYQIFGFGLTVQKNGLHGYKVSYLMGFDKSNWGQVAFCGNANTVFFQLTGLGLTLAADGWEKRLYDFLSSYSSSKITRVDLAHDFLRGEYSVDDCKRDWQNGLYNYGDRQPLAEQVGCDWLCGTKKGRTFYIGSPRSDRRVRCYEKGRQLGDPNSEWTRLELQLRSHKLRLPLDILLNPSAYFNGSYDAIGRAFDDGFTPVEKAKPEVKQKKQDLGIEHVIKYARMQVSPALKMFQKLGLDAVQMINTLFNETADMPKRLLKDGVLLPDFGFKYLHEFNRIEIPIEKMSRPYCSLSIDQFINPFWKKEYSYADYHREFIGDVRPS